MLFSCSMLPLGELRVNRLASVCSSRIYVGHNVQLAALAAYEPRWKTEEFPQARLPLQAIVLKIGSAEILVDSVGRELVVGLPIWDRRELECGIRDVRKDRRASGLHGLPFTPPMK